MKTVIFAGGLGTCISEETASQIQPNLKDWWKLQLSVQNSRTYSIREIKECLQASY